MRSMFPVNPNRRLDQMLVHLKHNQDMLAAAYAKATNIDPTEAELVEMPLDESLFGKRWYFRKRVSLEEAELLRIQLEHTQHEKAELQEQLDAARTKLANSQRDFYKALQFYAQPENYVSAEGEIYSPVVKDSGALAKKALGIRNTDLSWFRILGVFVCGACRKEYTVERLASFYQDHFFSVKDAPGWREIWLDENTDLLLCPECAKKEDEGCLNL